MDGTQLISLSLLIGRLITVFLMLFVIRKQYRVINIKTYAELRPLRITLLVGSIVIILGNVIPIVMNTLGLMQRGSFGLLVAYVYSNNITMLLSAYIIWYNMRLAERIKLSDKK